MPKIVYAPILEQAGFLKRKAAVVVEQWVYRLDGASQSWQLSGPIIIPSLNKIEVSAYVGFTQDPQGLNTLWASDSFGESFWVYARLGNYITVKVGTEYRSFDFPMSIGGFVKVTVDNTEVVVEHQGLIKRSDISQKPDINIIHLGSRKGVSEFLNGYIKNFTVLNNNVLVNQVSLTNKAQGANQLATAGNINATLINYTEDGWEKLEQQSEQVTTSDGSRVVTSDNKSITTM